MTKRRKLTEGSISQLLDKLECDAKRQYHSKAVSQPQHLWHLGPNESLLIDTVLCITGSLAASLVSTHQMPIVPLPQVVTTKMSPYSIKVRGS